jgi:hypothetical protein
MKLDFNNIVDYDRDYINLVFTLQRHIHLNNCFKSSNTVQQHQQQQQQQCRYKFPKEASVQTEIKVEKYQKPPNDYHVQINFKRVNDMNIVNHSKEQLQHWRANCECSLLDDLRRVIAYVSKYATKPESRSEVFSAAFASVFHKDADQYADTSRELKRVFTKVMAERDVTVQEALHGLLG